MFAHHSNVCKSKLIPASTPASDKAAQDESSLNNKELSREKTNRKEINKVCSYFSFSCGGRADANETIPSTQARAQSTANLFIFRFAS